jgi:hypothetical protein
MNMKKIFLVLAVIAVSVVSSFGQNKITSKKGEAYLPEKGDWGISIDATPFLDYTGQLLSSSGASAPTWNYLTNRQTIIGKYFADEKTAYRVIVRLGLNNFKRSATVDQPTTSVITFPNLRPTVEDEFKRSDNTIAIGAGIEKRKGKTRLQGYYGADAYVFTSGRKDKFTYGNKLAPAPAVPAVTVGNSYNFNNLVGGANNITTDTYGNLARVLENKTGRTIGVGARAFIGAEYFLFPKLSIGGDFGFGISFSTTGKGELVTESIGFVGANQQVGQQTREVLGRRDFSIDNSTTSYGAALNGANGAIRLAFHF